MDKCKPHQLPIYGEPKKVEYEFVPAEETAFTKNVTSFRKSLWSFLDRFQETSEKVQDKLGVAQAHSSDLLRYIQEDAGIVPKAIVITVAGMGGIVAGYRGRYIKKSFYASIGMVAAASICYPKQAVDISQYGWSRFKRDVMGTTDKVKPVGVGSVPKTLDPAKTNTPAQDFGQSKPEDKDMYTTRGS